MSNRMDRIKKQRDELLEVNQKLRKQLKSLVDSPTVLLQDVIDDRREDELRFKSQLTEKSDIIEALAGDIELLKQQKKELGEVLAKNKTTLKANERVCGYCEKVVNIDYEGISCESCGVELCMNCQQSQDDDSNDCPVCGKPIHKESKID